jgi:predicted HAD superfamily phosphohydrolase YqeG
LASLEDLGCLELPEGEVVLDLDNTVLPYLPTPDDVEQLAPKLAAIVATLPKANTVVVTTNVRNHPGKVAAAIAEAGLIFVAGARKPHPRRLLAATARPVAIVGDQPVTDGLLAWWLGVPFVLAPACSSRTPWWPRLMRLVGELVLRLFYRRATMAGDAP